MEPVTYALRRCGVCGRLAIGRRRRPGLPYLRGMATTLTVVLSSGGRSPRWLTSANPGRAGSAVVGPRDHRRAHDKRPRRRCLLLASVLYGIWMAGQAFRLIRACGFCGPMVATCWARRTQPGRRRPTALLCTHFARRIHRCALQLTTVAGTRASVSQLTPCRCERPLHAGKSAPGSRSLPKLGACRSAAITDTAKRPAARPPPPSCPMRRRVLAYHRRDNMPGQIGHNKAPWTIRQDHPGGKAPALGTHHET